MARKTYTREFKLQAVRMMTDQGLSVAEVARRLGVGENLPPQLEEGRPATGRRPPSPARATSPPPRTNSAASGPRSSACGPSGTS